MIHAVPRFSFTAATVVFIVFAAAAPRAFAEGLPETNGAFHAISVRHIDSVAAWYTNHLGFKVEVRSGNDHRRGALLTRPGTTLELAEFTGAVSREELRPETESHEIFGIFKLGFTTEELDETYEFLVDQGVEILFPIVAASDGRRTFGVKDPEGNIVQFFGDSGAGAARQQEVTSNGQR